MTIRKLGLALALVLALGTFSLAGLASDMVHVTLQMCFIPSGQWFGFYGGQVSAYARAGFDVTIKYATDGFASITEVAAGRAEFGYPTADQVLLQQAREEATDEHNVAIYQTERVNLFSVILKESSPITAPTDLIGKTVAVTGFNSPPYTMLLALLQKAGIGLDMVNTDPATKDAGKVNVVAVGKGAAQALVDGTADAITGYLPTEEKLNSLGVPIRMWYARDWVGNYGGMCLTTSQKLIDENPDMVRRFVQATHEGFLYAMEHPDEIAAYFASQFPEQAAAAGTELTVWKRLVNEVYLASEPGFGTVDPMRWEYTETVLLDAGVLSQPIDVAQAYSLDFYPR